MQLIKRRYWQNLIKLVITIILFCAIFRVTDIYILNIIISEIKYQVLVFAIVFQLLSNITASYRWHLIMHTLGFNENYVFYIKSYFKGTFFNQALPSSIGGDAFRVAEIGSIGYSKREAFYGIFIDRIIGLFGLLILNLIAILLNSNLLPKWLFSLITLICLSSIVGLFTLIVIRKVKSFENIPVISFFYKLSKRFRKVYNNKKSIFIQLLLSIVIHLFSILSVYTISRTIGMDYNLSVFLIIFPPVYLFTLIPISLAGWGVREGAMIGFFMLIGASKELVLSLSVLYGIIVILCSLPGMYFWIKSKNKL